jgi:hypothetical protein
MKVFKITTFLVTEDSIDDKKIEKLLNALSWKIYEEFNYANEQFVCIKDHSIQEKLRTVDFKDPSVDDSFEFEKWIDKSQEVIDEEVVKIKPEYLKNPKRNNFSLEK